jgi:hypothetical protein
MIDHMGFSVPASKYEEVLAFYSAILAPLGYSKQKEFPGMAVGFGPSEKSSPFWIACAKEGGEVGSGIHLAFQAQDHAAVDGFHAEGVKAGGTDNGKPGKRDYHPNYYAAFIIDPVG